MTARRSWVRAAVILGLGGLLAGRWAAVQMTETLWSASLGAQATHNAIFQLKLVLALLAFAVAGIWTLGNLYLVYRSIGSVHVPRRLGNLEIMEAVPRRHLALGTAILGLAIATAVSYRASSWWYAFALLGSRAPLDLSDPILHRDLTYYLFRLPWQRTVLGYLTTLGAALLVVVGTLYALLGAIRLRPGQLLAADWARAHLGGLLGIFGLVLAAGFLLEPAVQVASLGNLPQEAVLAEAKASATRLLAGMALVAGISSLAWVWVNRVALLLVPWGSLAALALVQSFLPRAASRDAVLQLAPELEAARAHFFAVAYGGPALDTTLDLPLAAPSALVERRSPELAAAPLWNGAQLTELLNRAAVVRPFERFTEPALSLYHTPAGQAVPVFLSAREVDLLAARETGAGLSWDNVHRGSLSRATGVLAVAATRTSPDGRPLFVGDLARPDSAGEKPVEVAGSADGHLFSPAAEDFVVVTPGTTEVAGIRPGPWPRRLALAWTLQSLRLLSTTAVPPRDVIVWRRAVARRLDRYAPFARFGTPFPVLNGGHLRWVAWGYVAAEAFPLAPPSSWHGRVVRYLRASLIGVVDAATGATAVYLAAQPDPVSAAWAELAPDIVQPMERLPAAVARHLRYPEELFEAQASLILGRTPAEPASLRFGTRSAGAPARGAAGQVSRPVWVVSTLPGDPTLKLRVRAVLERGEPGRLAALLDGSVEGTEPVLRVFRLAEPLAYPGPSQFAARVGRELEPGVAAAGPVTVELFPEGLVMLRSVYLVPQADSGLPRFREVVAGVGDGLGRGATPGAAVRAAVREAGPALPEAGDWIEARRWFRRLEAARRAGDWAAFGRAYERLRRLLGVAPDTLR